MNDHEARISVLEKLSENCDQQRADTHRRLEVLEEKFDQHLVTNAIAVTRLVTSVEAIQDDIKTALRGSLIAVKHEIIFLTLTKIGAVATVVIGAAWAIFKYIHNV